MPICLHTPVKHIFLSDTQQRRGVGTVEVSHRQRAAFVENRAFDQRHAFADMGGFRLSADDCTDGVLAVLRDVRDGRDFCAIFIIARIGFQRVAQRADMQFFKQSRLFWANALDKADAVLECGHTFLLTALFTSAPQRV